MDDLTKLLLLELGYDAGKPETPRINRNEEEDLIRKDHGEKLFDDNGMILLDGSTVVTGFGFRNNTKFKLKGKGYENCAVTNNFTFSPHDFLNGKNEVVKGRMGWFAMNTDKKIMDIEILFDGKDFISLYLKNHNTQIPWLYLPKLNDEGVNLPFLEALAKTSGLEYLNRFCVGSKEAWYKGSLEGLDVTIGDQGGDNYLVVLNKIGVPENQQRDALTKLLGSYTDVSVSGKNGDWPESLDGRVPSQITQYGIVTEVKKGSGYKIPGLIKKLF